MVTKRRIVIAFCVGLIAFSHASYADQKVPSSAEIERIKPKENRHSNGYLGPIYTQLLSYTNWPVLASKV